MADPDNKSPHAHAGDIKTLDGKDDDLARTTSIPQDDNGNTVINSADGEVFIIDRKAERALVWKFDLRLLPLLALMYLFNALDKSNLGNAKTAGEYLSSIIRNLKRSAADRSQDSRKTSTWTARTGTTYFCRSSSYPMF